MIAKCAGVILFVFFCSGCVSTKSVGLSDDISQSMSGSRLVVSKREIPDFVAMTPGKALFGVVGAAAMVSAGNKIVGENDISDPAEFIAKSLAFDLAEKHGMKLDLESVIHVSGSSNNKLARMSFETQADYLLDIQTVGWSVLYFPTYWNRYRVIYSAKLRLIHSGSKQIVAEGFCSRTPEMDEDSPSYDQMLENGAELIKSELQIAAEHCIGEFKKNAVNL